MFLLLVTFLFLWFAMFGVVLPKQYGLDDPWRIHGDCFESGISSMRDMYSIINGKNLVFHPSNHIPINPNKTNDTAVYCIWFHSKASATLALSKKINIKKIINNVQNSSVIQISTNGEKNTLVTCKDNFFYVSHTSSLISYHLCADQCFLPECNHIFSQMNMAPPPQPQTTNHPPFMKQIMIIGGICFALFFIIGMLYCFVYKYYFKPKDNNNKCNTKSEQVISEVLNEIAKYTIGETDEELFYADWMDEDTTSSSESGQEIGSKILQVVSSTVLPGLNTTNAIISSSSEEEECAVLVSSEKTNQKINKVSDYIKSQPYASKNENRSIIPESNQPKIVSDSNVSLP